MVEWFPLLDLPPEVSSSPDQRKILSSLDFTASVTQTGLLRLYSHSRHSLLLTLSNVRDISWLETTIFKFPLLLVSFTDSIQLISFFVESFESEPFDPLTATATFSLTPLSDHCSTLCTLPFQSSAILSISVNSFIVVTSDTRLTQYSIFPDGIYQTAQISSEGCSSFATSELFVAGVGGLTSYIWSSDFRSTATFDISSTSVCAVSHSQFALINDLSCTIIDMIDNSTKVIPLNKPSPFIVFLSDNLLYPPPNSFVASASYCLPLFVTEKSLVILNDEIFLTRLPWIFPLPIVIPILASRGTDRTSFVAETAAKACNRRLVQSCLDTADAEDAVSFLRHLLAFKPPSTFLMSIRSDVTGYCIGKIRTAVFPREFCDILSQFRELITPSLETAAVSTPGSPSPSSGFTPRLDISKLVGFVLDALEKHDITRALVVLQHSFTDYTPFSLFRTIVLQEAYARICQGSIDSAVHLVELLGESANDFLYEVWRNTTRRGTRVKLHDYLHKQGRLSQADEINYQMLMDIIDKYPNPSFKAAQHAAGTVASRASDDELKLPPWAPVVDLTSDFSERRLFIFEHLFNIPEENVKSDSPKYFVGNIALIENQPPKVLKNLRKENPNSIQAYWILHCEHKIDQLIALFRSEIDKHKGTRRLKCQKFVEKYYTQMHTYELETLLDLLCKEGFLCRFEQENIELLVIRLCKNKVLYDTKWWETCHLDFATFFKDFARYCAQKVLFMPFEMFVITHEQACKVDLRGVNEPLIRFIWDLWVSPNPAAAVTSCMQFIAKSDSTDPVQLWSKLPSDSLAPLAQFIWNKDPKLFQPDSPEVETLSARLHTEYPLLSSLVRGIIPHPQGTSREPGSTAWRSPIWTSKFDLEVHDLIQSHYPSYDFSKIFTNYYGQTPGQPNFPHFDHPLLVSAPMEPPYLHYVKSMLPLSAFQQAVVDGISADEFHALCLQLLRDCLEDQRIRLASLSFVELTDVKFGTDRATDFRLCIAIYDRLAASLPTDLTDLLSQIFAKHDRNAAIAVRGYLNASDLESYLVSVALGVKCGLSIDYAPIRRFVRDSDVTQLLLFVDRAAELGAHYPIADIVSIVTEEMPDSGTNEKDHLLWHLTQSLPTEGDQPTTDIAPALVVYRAVHRGDLAKDLALLHEALTRKTQLYALLATTIEGADLFLCAYVSILTLSDTPTSFDVTRPPEQDVLVRLFFQAIVKLLNSKRSFDLMQTLELFSKRSIGLHVVHFYRAIELFALKKAETALREINNRLTGSQIFKDDLLGNVNRSELSDTFLNLLDTLAKLCAEKSSIHIYHFLNLLEKSAVSPFLAPRVRLCTTVGRERDARRALVHCNLLGDHATIVSDIVGNSTLELGRIAAECLGISSTSATKQWLAFKYSEAVTPAQALEVHRDIAGSIGTTEKVLFLSLFASLLPFAQPTSLTEIVESALDESDNTDLSRRIRALLLHLRICTDHKIDIIGHSGALPSLSEVMTILFPGYDLAFEQIPLSLSSPVLFGFETLQHFFETSVDRVLDICLDQRNVADAHLICEWRGRDPHNIKLLETLQRLFAGDPLSSAQESTLAQFGSPHELQKLVDSIADRNGWRFALIALHYRASAILNLPTADLLQRKTSDFISSSLAVTPSCWTLVRDLISTSKMPQSDAALYLAQAFSNHVIRLFTTTAALQSAELPPDDYDRLFPEFANLTDSRRLIGDRFLKISQTTANLSVSVNLILHASICGSDLDECADSLDRLRDRFDPQLLIEIASVFPAPSLIPRVFQSLIQQKKLDLLPHDRLSSKVGRVIVNCARHCDNFEPADYLELTARYQLFRDHAELQMSCGAQLLNGFSEKLTVASKHYLLALAYFLKEKCYSLSMECLRKLSLISLQLELPDCQLMHLEKRQVLQLMGQRDFPFALTVAVAYDMDAEVNWADAIWEHSIAQKGEEFLNAFQFFRPITANLCEGIVRKFRMAGGNDRRMRERMKQFLDCIPNLVERYRITKALEFTDHIEKLKKENPVVCEWCERVLTGKP